MRLFPKDDTNYTFTLTNGKNDFIFQSIEGDKELFCITSTGYCLNIESSEIYPEFIGNEIELVLSMGSSLVSSNLFIRKLLNIT